MSGARCKSCGRPIYWVVTESGKRTPLIRGENGSEPLAFDADESPKGRVQESIRELGLFDDETKSNPAVVTVRVLKETDSPDPGLPVWRAHFWDCPYADEHRRR